MCFYPKALGSVSMCVPASKWCVHVYSGCVKAAVVALCGPTECLLVHEHSHLDTNTIKYVFSVAAMGSVFAMRSLPPCYDAYVCVCVVFAKMDADFRA